MKSTKTVFIGDIHGRTIWKDILNIEKDADKIVFIGDYWDSFNVEFDVQMKNFKNICQFKRQNPEKVVLLFGNHDLHYIIGETYSGKQINEWDIEKVILDNLDLFQVCYHTEEFIAVHAGITKTFLKRVGIKFNKNMSRNLTQMFEETPNKFGWNGYNIYGDDITQGPMWVREKSLSRDMIPITHVVGHTVKPDIHLITKSSPYPIWMIDCLGNRKYLVHENGEFKRKILLK